MVMDRFGCLMMKTILKMRVPLSAEWVHRAGAFEFRPPHQLLDQRVQDVVIRVIGIDEGLDPGYIQQVIRVLDRDENGGDIVQVMWAVRAQRLHPLDPNGRLVALG